MLYLVSSKTSYQFQCSLVQGNDSQYNHFVKTLLFFVSICLVSVSCHLAITMNIEITTTTITTTTITTTTTTTTITIAITTTIISLNDSCSTR